MIYLSSNSVLLQTVAALLIFIVGYFVLLFCVTAGLVIVDLIYRGGRLLWHRAMAHAPSTDDISTEVSGTAQMAPRHVGFLSHLVAAVRRPSP